MILQRHKVLDSEFDRQEHLELPQRPRVGRTKALFQLV